MSTEIGTEAPPAWIHHLDRASKEQLKWVQKNYKEKTGKKETKNVLFRKVIEDVRTAEPPKWAQSAPEDVELDELLTFLSGFIFISDKILSKLKTYRGELTRSVYSATIGSSRVKMVIIMAPSWQPLPQKFIDNAMRALTYLLSIAPKKASSKKNIDVTLIPIPVSKTRATDCHWTPNEINSGVSGDSIVLWRRDEILKVLIHELIHQLCIDYGDQYFANRSENAKIESNLTAPWFISEEPRWNEGFTETLATIVHIALLGTVYALPVRTIELLLEYERQHAKLQVFSLFNNCTKPREDTAVFSYFVVKMILLDDSEDFLKLIGNSTYDDFIRYVKTRLDRGDIRKLALASANEDAPPHMRMSCIAL
jgi:hypothetical protein